MMYPAWLEKFVILKCHFSRANDIGFVPGYIQKTYGSRQKSVLDASIILSSNEFPLNNWVYILPGPWTRTLLLSSSVQGRWCIFPDICTAPAMLTRALLPSSQAMCVQSFTTLDSWLKVPHIPYWIGTVYLDQYIGLFLFCFSSQNKKRPMYWSTVYQNS